MFESITAQWITNIRIFEYIRIFFHEYIRIRKNSVNINTDEYHSGQLLRDTLGHYVAEIPPKFILWSQFLALFYHFYRIILCIFSSHRTPNGCKYVPNGPKCIQNGPKRLPNCPTWPPTSYECLWNCPKRIPNKSH